MSSANVERMVKECVAAQMGKLMEYLGLPAEERSFIAHLFSQPGDVDAIKVFSDWLEENGQDERAKQLRRAAG